MAVKNKNVGYCGGSAAQYYTKTMLSYNALPQKLA